MSRATWFALALCAALALPGASGAAVGGSPAPSEAAAKKDDKSGSEKSDKKGKDSKDSKDEPAGEAKAEEKPASTDEAAAAEGEEGAPPEDIGEDGAGGSMPGREGGGGSSDVMGAEESLPGLGEPNIPGTPKVKVTLRNGTVLEGRLTHVFKGSDKWNADPQPAPQLTINVDVHELLLDWKSVKTVTGRDADPASDIDCWTNQDAVPLEYECTLAQPTFVKMKTTHQYPGDYKVVDKEPYTLVLDGNLEKRAMLYLYKIPLKIQDDGTPESDALARLQVVLKEKNQVGVKSIAFE